MGKGIQIRKPEASSGESSSLESIGGPPSKKDKLSPVYYGMVFLTFLASIVALWFFVQSHAA